ncbi:hypothetical protein ACOMHN_031808 [Nucella lapillus]
MILNKNFLYIGSSVNLRHRWANHKSDCKLRKGHKCHVAQHFLDKQHPVDPQFTCLRIFAIEAVHKKENLGKRETWWQDNHRNSFLSSCSLRTTVATVSSRRLTGSEADKLGRPPGGLLKHGLLPAGLYSLWDGQPHFPAQGQDDVLPLRTATMQRQTIATLQEFSLGGYGSSLTSDVCRLEGSSCQLAAVATPAILSIEISLTC